METVYESLASGSVSTSPNTAYQTVQPSSRESMDIGTSANEAYISTPDIATSVQHIGPSTTPYREAVTWCMTMFTKTSYE